MKWNKLKLRGSRRAFFALAMILAAGLCVTGCMNGGNVGNLGKEGGVNEERVIQPSPSPDYMPGGAAGSVTGSGNNTNGNAVNENLMGFDWTKNAPQIEGRIAQLSEISEARVVVTGNTALVAVRFNQAYQGEMTERIREMVAAEVMQADPNITTVAVTADAEDVKSVYEISDRVLGGTAMDELKEDINEIVRNATTLR